MFISQSFSFMCLKSPKRLFSGGKFQKEKDPQLALWDRIETSCVISVLDIRVTWSQVPEVWIGVAGALSWLASWGNECVSSCCFMSAMFSQVELHTAPHGRVVRGVWSFPSLPGPDRRAEREGNEVHGVTGVLLLPSVLPVWTSEPTGASRSFLLHWI